MDRSRSRRPTQSSSSSAGRDTRLRALHDGELIFDWGVNGEWKTWQVTSDGIKVLQLHGYGAGDRISAAIYSRLVAVGGICSLGVSERASVPTEKATRQNRIPQPTTTTGLPSNGGSHSIMWRALTPDESPGRAVGGTKQRKTSPEKLALKRLQKRTSNHQTTESEVPGSERGSLLLRNEKGLLYFRRWTREGFVTWHVNGDGERLLRKHELWEGYRLSSNLFYELLKGEMLYTLNDETPDSTSKR